MGDRVPHGQAALVALAMTLVVDGAHAQTMPLGSRTASMGGAAAARGRDGAMPYVNPAGFGAVKSTTLSLSASLYRYRFVEVRPFYFHDAVDPGFGELVGLSPEKDNRAVSEGLGAFPGSASVLWHFGGEEGRAHHVLAASVLVIQNVDDVFEGDFFAVFDGGQGEFGFRDQFTAIRHFTDYLAGPSYAFDSGGLRFGLAALFSYTTGAKSVTSNTAFSGSDFFFSSKQHAFSEATAFGFRPAVGAQWDVSPHFGVGASVAFPSLHLTGTQVNQQSADGAGPAAQPDATFVSVRRESGEFERRLPLSVRVGVAVEAPRRFGLAADVSLDLAREAAFSSHGEGDFVVQEQGQAQQRSTESFDVTRDSVLRLAARLGGEGYVSDSVALRGGLYYEPSATRGGSETEDVLTLHMNSAGLTLGLGLDDEVGETTFGVDMAYHWGRSAAPDVFNSGSGPVVRSAEASGYSLQAFIGGAIEVGELGEWAKALREADQVFQPETRRLAMPELSFSFAQVSTYPELASLAQSDVGYIHTGLVEFDGLFRKLAQLRLTLQLAPKLLDQASAAVARARASWGERSAVVIERIWLATLRGGASSVPEDLRGLNEVDALARQLHAVVAVHDELVGVGQQLAALPLEVRQLREVAQHKLVGPHALKLPAVLSGLERAKADVELSAAQLPALSAAYARLLDSLNAPSPLEPPLPQPQLSPGLHPTDTSPATREDPAEPAPSPN